MLLAYMIFLCIFSSNIYSAELPQFTVVKDVLEDSEMIQLGQLTKGSQPNLSWYGRYNLWYENFQARLNGAGEDLIFTHFNQHACDYITDKLSKLLLTKVQEFGIDITNRRIIMESYFDRNIVDVNNAASSGMFWHRDTLMVDGQKKFADFSLILLANGKVQDWQGGDIVLQLGGSRGEDTAGSYNWINSDFPKINVTSRYNQAIIFKNSDTGHMVTPLTLLSGVTVHREVFIITCYLQ